MSERASHTSTAAPSILRNGLTPRRSSSPAQTNSATVAVYPMIVCARPVVTSARAVATSQAMSGMFGN
jgi:hypothetical protein